MTDDGSYGEHGFVTVKLQQLLEAGAQYDEVLAIGPIPMMNLSPKPLSPLASKPWYRSILSWLTGRACAAAAA
jgi:ferredoxin--NADP+ reductase